MAIALVSILAACDGGGSGATVACTMGTGSARMCVESSIPSGASAQAIQGQNDACVNASGVPSSACSHAGADGGCRVKSTAPGAEQTVTTWLYAGNADNEKMACTSNGQTWIVP